MWFWLSDGGGATSATSPRVRITQKQPLISLLSDLFFLGSFYKDTFSFWFPFFVFIVFGHLHLHLILCPQAGSPISGHQKPPWGQKPARLSLTFCTAADDALWRLWSANLPVIVWKKQTLVEKHSRETAQSLFCFHYCSLWYTTELKHNVLPSCCWCHTCTSHAPQRLLTFLSNCALFKPCNQHH